MASACRMPLMPPPPPLRLAVVGQGTVGERWRAEVVNAAAAAHAVSPTEREPLKRRVPVAATCKRRKAGALAARSMLVVAAPAPIMVNVLVITGRPLVSGAVVMNCRQGIGTRHQGNSIRLPVRIRRRDSSNEALHIPRRRTRKVGGLARLPVPEEAEE